MRLTRTRSFRCKSPRTLSTDGCKRSRRALSLSVQPTLRVVTRPFGRLVENVQGVSNADHVGETMYRLAGNIWYRSRDRCLFPIDRRQCSSKAERHRRNSRSHELRHYRAICTFHRILTEGKSKTLLTQHRPPTRKHARTLMLCALKRPACAPHLLEARYDS